jgi:SMODS and SLOG-associating 2TM effector domain family 5
MRDYLFTLRTQAWRTAGARYNASRRLRRRELFSTASLAMFSALSVAVAFVQRIYVIKPGTALDNYLAALSICLGIFLLAISLMEWGAANGAKADALHRNAEDLNAFQRKLAQLLAQIDSQEALGWKDVDKLREEYEVIKERCSHNHSPLDDQLFRATQRSAPEFANTDGNPRLNKYEGVITAIKWHLSSVWYFAMFWLAIAAGIAFAFLVV